MLKIFLRYPWKNPEICLRYAWDMFSIKIWIPETYQKNALGMPDKHICYIPYRYLIYAWDMPKYVWYIPEICLRYGIPKEGSYFGISISVTLLLSYWQTDTLVVSRVATKLKKQ